MAPPKTILDKIIYAIRAQPPTHLDGPSRTAIVKYLQNEMSVDTKGKSSAIKNGFKKGVEKGKLIQNGQRYRVVGDAIPEVAVEPEVKIEDIKEGSSGEMCDVGDTVIMKYEGKLDDGTIFDSSSNFEFTLGAGEVIKGWDKGILGMKIGGKRKLFVPAKLGYGKRGAPPEIPPNADLHFIVKLKKIK